MGKASHNRWEARLHNGLNLQCRNIVMKRRVSQRKQWPLSPHLAISPAFVLNVGWEEWTSVELLISIRQNSKVSPNTYIAVQTLDIE